MHLDRKRKILCPLVVHFGFDFHVMERGFADVDFVALATTFFLRRGGRQQSHYWKKMQTGRWSGEQEEREAKPETQ